MNNGTSVFFCKACNSWQNPLKKMEFGDRLDDKELKILNHVIEEEETKHTHTEHSDAKS